MGRDGNNELRLLGMTWCSGESKMEYRHFARFCDEAGFSDLLSNRVVPLDDDRALAEGLMVPVLEAIEALDIYGRDDPEL